MPQDFIHPNPQLTPDAVVAAPKINQFVTQLRALMDLGDQIVAIGFHNVDGGDYSDFEMYAGVSSGEGSGAFILDYINGTLLALRGAQQNNNAVALIDRVG